jgi:hypothetical protein
MFFKPTSCRQGAFEGVCNISVSLVGVVLVVGWIGWIDLVLAVSSEAHFNCKSRYFVSLGAMCI